MDNIDYVAVVHEVFVKADDGHYYRNPRIGTRNWELIPHERPGWMTVLFRQKAEASFGCLHRAGIKYHRVGGRRELGNIVEWRFLGYKGFSVTTAYTIRLAGPVPRKYIRHHEGGLREPPKSAIGLASAIIDEAKA